MKKDISQLLKCEKQMKLVEYAWLIAQTENRFITKREIRKVFHVELYNYFENIFALYQELGIDVPLGSCPKKYAVEKIIRFVRARSEEGLYPTKVEIEKKFNIQIYSYFKNIEDIYHVANIDFNLYEKRCYYLEANFNSEEENKQNIKRIINYIRSEHKNGNFVGVDDIQKSLNLAFYKYFKSTWAAYNEAGINYQRVCPIILGKNKEKALTKISIELLKRMGYIIERVSIFDKENFNKGEDIKLSDSEGNHFLVEIKAYRMDQSITVREIKQLEDYMEKEKINRGIFITTSYKVNHNPKNIEIIDGNKLISLLKKYHLMYYLDKVKWIQEERVSLPERLEAHEMRRREIIKYVLDHPGIKTLKPIQKALRLHIRTYFNPPNHNLIENIRKQFSNDNAQLCKAHSQERQGTLLARE